MTASSTVTARSSQPLPRLRSRGGSGAGSSDYPGRRNPRAAGSPLTIQGPEFVARVRATLMAQRSFRVQQLQELDTAGADAGSGAARREVRLALRTAAWSALREIDAALGRIRQGNYGRCPRCGDTLSVERVRALPMTSLCGRCQRATAMAAATDSNAPNGDGHPITTPSRGERHHDH